MILASHGIIGSQITQFVGLLDTYSGAAAAYSLRKLRTAYTGSAIRVRRASDNTEQDIGFVNNVLDTSTLTSFCSGTNGFVKTWYDQSGNGYDASQTTAANQPQIVSSGSLITENGKAAVQFDGSNDNLNTASFQMTSAFSVFGAFNITTTSGFRSLISHNFVSSGNAFLTQGRWILIRTGSTAQDWVNGDAVLIGDGSTSNRYPRFVSNGSTFTANTQYVASGILSSSTSQIWANGSAASARVQQTSSISAETGKVYIGSSEIYDQFQGKIQEVFIYDTDQSSNRTGIETNINAQYNIYWDGSQTSLLDTYSGSAAAYSLRALSSAYTGPLIRVRRASDNAEQDIYAKYDGTLNVDALENFCASTNGFVKTWYDQSGNSRDATQTTAANQPQIVSSGSVILENGKPAVDFDGTDDYCTLSAISLSDRFSQYGVITHKSISTNQTIGIAKWVSSSNSRSFINRLTSTNDYDQFVSQDGVNSDSEQAYSSATINNTYLYGLELNLSNTDKFFHYRNGSRINSGLTTSITSLLDDAVDFELGSFGSGGSNLNGTMQEIIFYPSDQSSNRTGIETNINNFYSIY